MANTNATINATLIAQRTLETLLANFPLLTRLARNFQTLLPNGQRPMFNQTVNAHVVTAPGAAPQWDAATGYTPSNRVQVDVPVVLNRHAHHTYAVNDQERTSTAIDLIDRYALTGAYALGQAVYADLFALFTAANYPYVYDVTPANWDRDDLIEIGIGMNERNVSKVERSIVANSRYAGNLFKDKTIVSADFVDGRPAVTATLGNVHNFDISEYSVLPNLGEDLSAIALVPEAAGIAITLPEPPDGSRRRPHGSGNRAQERSLAADAPVVRLDPRQGAAQLYDHVWRGQGRGGQSDPRPQPLIG
jgi:hypothetical protein